MIEKGINSPKTSSMGRLFDAVACLLNLKNKVTYEGEAAIALENCANKFKSDKELTPYNFSYKEEETIQIKTNKLWMEIIEDLLNKKSRELIAYKFHFSIANLILEIANRIRDKTGINKIALSGGVFQNRILVTLTMKLLENENFEIYTNQILPPNDGGISLGQAYYIGKRLEGCA